jgi:hypothetical protein
MNIDCAREQDVLDMLAARRWPGGCDADMADHIRECAGCRDLVTAAAALLDEHECAWSEARVPPSTVVWWRAQVRAREEAARAAGRPIAFVQGVAASCAVWVAVSLMRDLPLPARGQWREWISSVWDRAPDVSAVAAAVPGGTSFLILAGVSVLFVPIALFVALREGLRDD